jgi:hypothetical protein
MEKIRIRDLQQNITDHISQSLDAISWVKKFFAENPDPVPCYPGSGIWDGKWIREKHPGPAQQWQ